MFELLTLVVEELELVLQLLLEAVVLAALVLRFALLVLQVGLELLGPLLALGELLVALVYLAVVLALELYELLLGLENTLLLEHLSLGFGLLHGGLATFLYGVFRYEVGDGYVDANGNEGGDAGSQNDGCHLSVFIIRLIVVIKKPHRVPCLV